MKNISKIIVLVSILTIVSIPLFSYAAQDPDNGGLVPCGNEVTPFVKDKTGKTSGGEILNPCGFDELMIMINKVIHFILFDMVLPISAIMFAYAGFLLLTSGGEAAKKTKAKNIFTNVAMGLIIAVLAWLIINTILSILGYDGAWIGFK